MMLDVFIEGETIDLCIPTLEYVQTSDWYSWVNNPNTTSHIAKLGVFPNTRGKQEKYFLEQSEKRLLLLISNKHSVGGVISISNIDYQSKIGEISIMMKSPFRANPLEALEAVCLITEHAFEKIGLNKIIAKQHIELISWSHRMSLAGYRLEGISKMGFVNGRNITDLLYCSCLFDDYTTISSARNGKLWDSQKKMLERIKNLPKTSIHKKMIDFFEDNEKYYEDIFLS